MEKVYDDVPEVIMFLHGVFCVEIDVSSALHETT